MTDENTTGALTTEKQTYRAYIQTSSDKDGKTVVDKIKSQAEAAAKDKKTNLSSNWQKLENEGWSLLNENEFIRYTVKTLAGFFALIPDKDQQLYIIQCGLNYAMNAKANAVMVALKDGAAEPTAEFDGQTIDLRLGVDSEGKYSINEAPTRKSLTDMEKLMKTASGLNLSPEQLAMLLEQVGAQYAANKAAAQEGAEETEEVTA